MNRKQLALLLFLALALGLAGLAVYRHQTASFQSGGAALGKKLLGEFPVNDVTAIVLKQGASELNLVKKDNLWRVRERRDYPANYPQIAEFLLKIADQKIAQSELVGPSQLPRFGLVPGAGTNAAIVVEFKGQSDKLIKALLLGKPHLRKSTRPSPYGDDQDDRGWPDGRYVKAGADSPDVAVISDPLSNIEPKPDQWLNKDFFKVEKARSLAVAFPAATNSWKLTRDTDSGEWKLAEAKPGEQLDSSKISSLSAPLGAPSFADVDITSKPEQLGLDKPTVITLETSDGFAYTLKVGVKTNDNYPVLLAVSAQLPKERAAGKDEKPEDKARLDKEFKDQQKKLADKLAQEQPLEKWTYLVSSWTFDSILKDRAQLLQEKKETPASADAAAVPETSKN